VPKTGRTSTVLLGVFFLTGAAGLIYEVVWLRLLILVFGATVFAISAVLVSFMAGLAIGAFVFGRLSDRVRHPLRLFALLEIGIAGAALLLPSALRLSEPLYIWINGTVNPSFLSLSVLRFVISFLLLLIPACLMGGTLPALVRFFTGSMKSLGHSVALLYSVNTFGAVVGAFAAGFVLIGTIGILGTTLLAVLLNVVAAAVSIVLSIRVPYSVSESKSHAEPSRPCGRAVPTFILWAIALSGFAALAYEVIWTRALSIVLSSTIYSFTAMLTAFLLGIALGSILFAKIIDRWRSPLFVFGVVEWSIGVSTLYVLSVIGNLPVILGRVFRHVESTWLQTILGGYVLSFHVMLVTTVLLGMTIPLAVKIYSGSLKKLGRNLGNIYSCNTLGCILGSLAAGFVLIPFIGIRNSSMSMSALNILIGLSAIGLAVTVPAKRRIPALAVALCAASVFFPAWAKKYKQVVPISAGTGHRLLHYEEGPGGTVIVAEHKRSGEKLCFVDNSFVCGTSYNALKTVRMLGHLPVLMCESPNRVLIIGFGMGVTSHSVSLHPEVKEIHIAELTRGIVEASVHFRDYNGGVLRDPRVTIEVEDGRNYLLLSDEKYDCITCDPTHPVLGSGALYTEEYFRLCREMLNPGGTVAQYLPLHMLSFSDFKSIARTFSGVFPDCCLWLTFSHCVLLGRMGPMVLDFPELERRIAQPGVRQDLAKSDLDTPMEFLSCFMLCAEEIRDMAGDAPLNTDNLPLVEFSGIRSFRDTWASNLDSLARRRQSPELLLKDASPHVRQSMQVYSRARGESLRGRVCQYEGRYEDALEHYSKALSDVSDDNETLILAAHARERMRAQEYPR